MHDAFALGYCLTGFIDKARADHIIEIAKKYLSPSALAYKPGDSIPETQNVSWLDRLLRFGTYCTQHCA